jgi:hypothetical protein
MMDNLKSIVQRAHEYGLTFKIYNTMRELSNRCRELWAMRAWNETYLQGPGMQGASWLQEHIEDNYLPAWSNGIANGDIDAAIRMTGLSRWNNYYVEGLKYLVDTADIDGLYLDECAYDHKTLMRVRRVLDNAKSGCMIDLHSDQGYYSLSPILNYMELAPFVDRLWFGEGFDYQDTPPDYWLVEISGIPFGLHTDLLIYGGYGFQHRGMVYGSADRWQPFSDPQANPLAIWQLWDQFGIDQAQFIGWWEDSVPVTSNCTDIRITSYVRNGISTLVAVGSWSSGNEYCAMYVDWNAIGLDEASCSFNAPSLPDFQTAATFQTNEALPIQQYYGWIFLIEPTNTR